MERQNGTLGNLEQRQNINVYFHSLMQAYESHQAAKDFKLRREQNGEENAWKKEREQVKRKGERSNKDMHEYVGTCY